jgi:hypothetical protein
MGTKRQIPLRKLGKVAILEDPKPEDRPDDTGLRLETAGTIVTAEAMHE